LNQVIKVNHKEFWHVRFPPSAMEWQFLTEKLRDSVEIKAWNDWIMTKHDASGDVMYLFAKERYPAELIAKTYGVDEAKLHTLEVIVLEAPKTPKDLPKPTVSGWGEA
jgi:hypothetical protein